LPAAISARDEIGLRRREVIDMHDGPATVVIVVGPNGRWTSDRLWIRDEEVNSAMVILAPP
jgi:hypothetical protein